ESGRRLGGSARAHPNGDGVAQHPRVTRCDRAVAAAGGGSQRGPRGGSVSSAPHVPHPPKSAAPRGPPGPTGVPPGLGPAGVVEDGALAPDRSQRIREDRLLRSPRLDLTIGQPTTTFSNVLLKVLARIYSARFTFV